MLSGLCRSANLGQPEAWDLDPRARHPAGVPPATWCPHARIRSLPPEGHLAASGGPAPLRRLFMVWETPAATDIRFGFEITLYVAAR